MTRIGVAATALITVAGTAFAGSSGGESQKLIACKKGPNQLIGLNRQVLKERCGIWSEVQKTTSPTLYEEVAIYRDTSSNPVMFVYLRYGMVISVETR
jgi:hypothetical protein